MNDPVTAVIRSELARVAGVLGTPEVEFVLERPRDQGHGDLATNLAMVAARTLKTNPRKLAERVISELQLPPAVVSRTEIAGPGFINFWLAGDQLAGAVRRILSEGKAYGRSVALPVRKFNIEFVSANPTGPLHVGHGRGAALGDAIASLFEWTGHNVTREFYVNDAGVQIGKLAASLWARIQQAVGREAAIPEGGYHGEYLKETAQAVLDTRGREFADRPAEQALAECRLIILETQRAEQDRLMTDFGVHFDVIASEQSIYDRGLIDTALATLAARGLTYEKDGALWLRTTDFGDDQDRVLRKQDGSYTYFVPDIAYHVDKHARGFDRVIDVWGADHHGYIPRMRAALQALGYPAEFFDVELVQLVKVVRGGEEVKMSKRSGEFITLRDLADEVGVDAARYFFLMRRGDSHLIFDVDLAKKQTDENPVFYVQMAHARLSGIFRTAGVEPDQAAGDFDLGALPAAEDTELAKQLTRFPEVVAKAALEREPHRITVYLEELAGVIHGWYHNTRTVGETPPIERARLLLARAARIVVANGLTLLGLSAPDRM
ncbi:MAG TPA: arginine--tRNA ligase [Gemmatimonadales bacterium]|nr:arginine--tRNA ligase [Gemmatimonadales bacterium]